MSQLRFIVAVTEQHPSLLAELLEERGALVFRLPVLRIVPLLSEPKKKSLWAQIHNFDWLLFTSQHAVRIFFSGSDPDQISQFKKIKIGAIGEKTAECLHDLGFDSIFNPKKFHAEGFLEEFSHRVTQPVRLLFPRARLAREILVEGLVSAGHVVELVPIYETLCPTLSQEYLEKLKQPYDWLILTSAASVRHLVSMVSGNNLAELKKLRVACLGPVTARTAETYGFKVELIAPKATMESLVKALGI